MSRKKIALLVFLAIAILGGLGYGLYALMQRPTSPGNTVNTRDEIPESVQQQVTSNIQSGNIEKAREVAEKQYQESPSPQTGRLLVQVEASDKNHKRVIEIIQSIDEQSRDYQDYNNLADAYRASGDVQKAIDAYRKTIELWPKDDVLYQSEVEYFQETIRLLQEHGSEAL